MSVFERLLPPASSRQTVDPPSSVSLLSPPLSLSSPVVKKKAIQIPSFDERGGLVRESQETAGRSFVPICSSETSRQASSGLKWCQRSIQKIHGERASTLPRSKPRTYSSLAFSDTPSVSVPPKPSVPHHHHHHLPTSPSLQRLQPKPSASPTLTVPAPRLSPSPTSMCRGLQPSPGAKERRAKSINISNARAEPSQSVSGETKRGLLDQEALLDFTRPERRSSESRYPTLPDSRKQVAASQDSGFLRGKVAVAKSENVSDDKAETPFATANAKSNARSLCDGSAAHRKRSDCCRSGHDNHSDHVCSASTTETRRRRLHQLSDAEVDTTPSCFNLRRHEEDNRSHTSSQSRFWSKAQSRAARAAEAWTSEGQSGRLSRDYSGPSRDAEASKWTCLVLPQVQEASRPDAASHRGQKPKHERPPAWTRQDETHKEVLSERPQCPSEDGTASGPRTFSPNSSGASLKRVFDSPSPSQRRPRDQRPREDTSCSVMVERAEEPCYVTMFYPGSVYVGEY